MEGEIEETKTQIILEPIVLDLDNIDELRFVSQTAFDKKKSLEKGEAPISKERLDAHISSMEKDIENFAQDGYFRVSWDFGKINTSIRHLREVAIEFKKRHPYFMQIVHEGTLKISIDWELRR